MIFSPLYRKEYKSIFWLAYPVVLSQLGHILVSVADSVMAGRIGTVQLAAASLGNSIFTIVLVFGLGISFSITPLVARADGRKNHTRIALVLLNGIFLNTLVGIVLFLAFWALSPYIAYLNQPEAVVRLAIPYVNVLFFSMVPLMVFQAFKQFAEGLSLTKQSMFISIFANVLNVGLNYVLIYGKLGLPAMGLLGAAWATFISRVLMALMMGGYVLLFPRFARYLHFMRRQNLSWAHMFTMVKLGLPISLQMIFEMGAFSFSAVMIGWIGARDLASHQIALNVASVTYMMASGISAAATIRVGKLRGAGDMKGVHVAGYSSLVMGALFMAASATLIILCKDLIPLFYVKDDAAVHALAAQLLIIAAIFQLSDGVQVVGLGALRGLEDVKVPSMISLFSYWLIALPLGYGLGFWLDLGAKGIWLGLFTGLTFAAVLLFFRFRRFSPR
ncbi:MATE family efflux transporter [Rufibacter quisquiliarum]|uniref:Multidrug-efflux transporter n=1 Tax=Rufibacter quisquiliarum TaxID=1549639 RepID=A0A839GFZ7_9BACT|nr:MATE family multidrug resistance protein [Rufibacter quisquiliarum]